MWEEIDRTELVEASMVEEACFDDSWIVETFEGEGNITVYYTRYGDMGTS
jgi:hypothetical protein